MWVNYTMSLLYIFLAIFVRIQPNEPKDIHLFLKNQLRIGSACEVSPCFLGQPIKDMSQNEVYGIITTSSISEWTIFTDGGPNAIEWLWSSDIGSVVGFYLHPDALKRDDYNVLGDFTSGIGFHEGSASSVWFSFATEFKVLVDLYGEPEFVVPLTYTRWGTMRFKVFFRNVDGYFVASTDCMEPHLVADTEVIGYTSTIYPLYHPYDVIMWKGYTDKLPDCTYFQP